MIIEGFPTGETPDLSQTLDPIKLEKLRERKARASARLVAHLATPQYAYFMGGSHEGGNNHPVHRETRAKTKRLQSNYNRLKTQLTKYEI